MEVSKRRRQTLADLILQKRTSATPALSSINGDPDVNPTDQDVSSYTGYKSVLHDNASHHSKESDSSSDSDSEESRPPFKTRRRVVFHDDDSGILRHRWKSKRTKRRMSLIATTSDGHSNLASRSTNKSDIYQFSTLDLKNETVKTPVYLNKNYIHSNENTSNKLETLKVNKEIHDETVSAKICIHTTEDCQIDRKVDYQNEATNDDNANCTERNKESLDNGNETKNREIGAGHATNDPMQKQSVANNERSYNIHKENIDSASQKTGKPSSDHSSRIGLPDNNQTSTSKSKVQFIMPEDLMGEKNGTHTTKSDASSSSEASSNKHSDSLTKTIDRGNSVREAKNDENTPVKKPELEKRAVKRNLKDLVSAINEEFEKERSLGNAFLAAVNLWRESAIIKPHLKKSRRAGSSSLSTHNELTDGISQENVNESSVVRDHLQEEKYANKDNLLQRYIHSSSNRQRVTDNISQPSSHLMPLDNSTEEKSSDNSLDTHVNIKEKHSKMNNNNDVEVETHQTETIRDGTGMEPSIDQSEKTTAKKVEGGLDAREQISKKVESNPDQTERNDIGEEGDLGRSDTTDKDVEGEPGKSETNDPEGEGELGQLDKTGNNLEGEPAQTETSGNNVGESTMDYKVEADSRQSETTDKDVSESCPSETTDKDEGESRHFETTGEEVKTAVKEIAVITDANNEMINPSSTLHRNNSEDDLTLNGKNTKTLNRDSEPKPESNTPEISQSLSDETSTRNQRKKLMRKCENSDPNVTETLSTTSNNTSKSKQLQIIIRNPNKDNGDDKTESSIKIIIKIPDTPTSTQNDQAQFVFDDDKQFDSTKEEHDEKEQTTENSFENNERSEDENTDDLSNEKPLKNQRLNTHIGINQFVDCTHENKSAEKHLPNIKGNTVKRVSSTDKESPLTRFIHSSSGRRTMIVMSSSTFTSSRPHSVKKKEVDDVVYSDDGVFVGHDLKLYQTYQEASSSSRVNKILKEVQLMKQGVLLKSQAPSDVTSVHDDHWKRSFLCDEDEDSVFVNTVTKLPSLSVNRYGSRTSRVTGKRRKERAYSQLRKKLIGLY